MNSRKIIKYSSNRKLYDTEKRTYVNYDYLLNLIREGVEFHVDCRINSNNHFEAVTILDGTSEVLSGLVTKVIRRIYKKAPNSKLLAMIRELDSQDADLRIPVSGV